jgi:hypothetical protein
MQKYSRLATEPHLSHDISTIPLRKPENELRQEKKEYGFGQQCIIEGITSDPMAQKYNPGNWHSGERRRHQYMHKLLPVKKAMRHDILNNLASISTLK